MKNLLRVIAGAVAMATLMRAQAPTAAPARQQTPPRLAVSIEPIAAIVEAFRSHAIVALGNEEFRGNEQCHAFRLSLIRDPRFTGAVNDIVVEFGNARYQDLMDRFVEGEEVPYESLRQVWLNTTQPVQEWAFPIYEEFFRAVRLVNVSLPREHRLRVLLGDPPIDWDSVHSREDIHKWLGDRDAHAVRVIRREVLEKGRRALVIYGEEHLIRKNTVIGAADEWARGLVAQLERSAITNVFTINPETRRDLKTVQADVALWPKPSLAMLRGTALGAAIFAPGPQRRPVRMEEQFDAILYLGPPSAMTMAQLSPALCSGLPSSSLAPTAPAARLKEYCATLGGNTEIPDREPAITYLIREMIRDAAQGKVDPARIAPESRERLIPFLQDIGPRFLGPAGALESLTLLVDTHEGGKHVRRYRAVFANGPKIIWTVGLSSAGSIVSLDPRPE